MLTYFQKVVPCLESDEHFKAPLCIKVRKTAAEIPADAVNQHDENICDGCSAWGHYKNIPHSVRLQICKCKTTLGNASIPGSSIEAGYLIAKTGIISMFHNCHQLNSIVAWEQTKYN